MLLPFVVFVSMEYVLCSFLRICHVNLLVFLCSLGAAAISVAVLMVSRDIIDYFC